MGPILVVVSTLSLHLFGRICKRQEPVRVQALARGCRSPAIDRLPSLISHEHNGECRGDLLTAARRGSNLSANMRMSERARQSTIFHDHDAILDAWKRGERSGELAVRFGTSAGYIRTIVKNARERGDPRAELRGALASPGQSRRNLDHDAILDRWQAGWRAEDIARFAHTTAETIYDLLMNYRRRGDPRALRRRLPNP